MILMGSCLVFLTGINLFIYPPVQWDCAAVIDETTENPDSFPVPVEEKSETSSSASIIEEFLHNSHYLELSWLDKMAIQKIHNAEQLQIMHYELWSPPPKLN